MLPRYDMAGWYMPLGSLPDTPEGLNASGVVARGPDVHNGSFTSDQVRVLAV